VDKERRTKSGHVSVFKFVCDFFIIGIIKHKGGEKEKEKSDAGRNLKKKRTL
jgi:hypothetical protein